MMAQQMEVMRFVESILKKMNESPIILRKIPVFLNTRMIGLQEASGAYVTFVDSDDWVEKTYIEELYDKLITYHADYSAANYYLFNDAESLFYFFMGEQDYYERLYTPVQLIDGLYETKFNKSFALLSAWGKLYKRTLFEDLLFPKGQIGEDGFFNLKAYLMSERVIYLNKGLYAYRERPGSYLELGLKIGCQHWYMLWKSVLPC